MKVRKSIVLVATTLAIATTTNAHSASRISATGKTCAEVKQFVKSNGKAVVRYREKGKTALLYDLFHAKRSSAKTPSEDAVRGYVVTADSARCFVGYISVQRTNDSEELGQPSEAPEPQAPTPPQPDPEPEPEDEVPE